MDLDTIQSITKQPWFKWVVLGGVAVLILQIGGAAMVGLTAIMAAPLAACAVLDDLPVASWFVDCDQQWSEYLAMGGLCMPGLSGELSGNIPREWAEIFNAAGADPDHPTNPNLLAAIYLTENGNKWKPFDYPWPQSEALANGPMQFIPGSWESHKQDGDGDGDMDIQDPWDSVFASAHHIQRSNVPADAPLGDLNKPGVPGTLLWAASDYNWGGEDNLSADAPLSSWPLETQNYLRNVYALLNSNLLTGGHPNYTERVQIVDKNDRVIGYPDGAGAGQTIQAGATVAGGPTAGSAPTTSASGSPPTSDGATTAAGPTAAPAPDTGEGLRWPTDTQHVTSDWGSRPTPEEGDGDATEHHGGTDFAFPDGNTAGKPIYAVADGTVLEAGPASGFGQWIVIQHTINGGSVNTWYGHMEDGTLEVSKGDTVTRGQKISVIGSNGRSTGPHLHFEVHPNGGESIDPIPWLQSNGATMIGGDSGSECGTPSSGSAIVDAAASQKGVWYSFGGGGINGPSLGVTGIGFDCSGLVMYAVYQGTGGENGGIKLPHSARMQQNGSQGVKVEGGRENWRPGDILFLVGTSKPDHVTIYAGKGPDGKDMMWSAPRTGDVVKYSEVYFEPTMVKRFT